VATGRLNFMPEPGRLELREYELPEVEDGAVLLRTLAAGVCGSELHTFNGHHPMKSGVLGHEIVGEVTERVRRATDSAGRPLRPGDRVTAPFFQTCMRCPACSRGELNLCRHVYDVWHQHPDLFPHFSGTHATHYYVTPLQWLYRVPDGVPDTVAASANCGLSQVWAGVERAGLRAGEHLVVQGAGGLGLYATAVAKERGATVTVVDAVAGRLDAARAFGADAVISLEELPDPADRAARVRELTGGEGADCVMEVAGVPQAFAEALELVRIGGRIVEIGNVTPGTTQPFDVSALTRRAIRILPVIRYQPWELDEALAFLSRNVDRLPLDRLLDRAYPLDALADALRDSQARTVNRAVIVP
jgi:threonine dehydrogenase-like Zn-dependent dehydrogenase